MSSQGHTVRLGQLEIFAEETGKGSPTLVFIHYRAALLPLVPQARFETLEGVGHLSPLEAPGELAEAIAEFVETKAERTPHDTK